MDGASSAGSSGDTSPAEEELDFDSYTSWWNSKVTEISPLQLAWKLAFGWLQIRFAIDPAAPWREKVRWSYRDKHPSLHIYHLMSDNENGTNGDRILGVHSVTLDDGTVILDLTTRP